MDIQNSYNPELVFLSILVAIFASYVALDISLRTKDARGKSLLAWLFAGALAMGLGIWSMHFVGMLALNMHGMQMRYDIPLSLLSIFVAVGASGLAFYIINKPRPNKATVAIGGTTMAIAISGMHYIGMYSMRMPAYIHWNYGLIAISVFIAAAASVVALLVALRLKQQAHTFRLHAIASLVLGTAVYGMHYVGMEAATFIHTNADSHVYDGLVLATDELAWSIGIATLIILIVALVSSAVDRILVSRQRLAQEEITHREAQLREAQRISHIGSWEWVYNSNKITYSDELLAIYEFTEAPSGTSFDKFFERMHPEDKNWVRQAQQKAIAEASSYNFIYRIRTASGQEKVLEARARVVKDASGTPIKIQGTTQDITDLKKIEAELKQSQSELEERVRARTADLNKALEREREAKEAAQNAATVKSQFLANMSHEIRTPMNSILGFSELLSMSNLDTDQADHLERIQANGAQLLKIIDDILDLSKFEAGKVSIERTVCKPADLIEDAIQSLAPLAQKKNLNLAKDISSDTPPEIFSDPARLQQILTNLLSNAIKFSEKGTIFIRTTLDYGNYDGKKQLFIDVEDKGVGIAPEAQSLLFQPFTQADNSIVRKFGGTGLGLALSRNIARSLGGDLKLQKSSEQEGSTFRLTLDVSEVPRHQSEVDTTKSKDASGPLANIKRGLRVLLVEDMPDNELLIRTYLQSSGFETETAGNGIEAIEKAESFNPDLILMDIQMPLLDGLEATRRLRNKNFTKPIIALTAHAMDQEIEKSYKAGCNNHLSKPIRRQALLVAINNVLKN
ncbi:MHYT domain-containing protein [Bdellovibrio sp. HCB209]|uniref:MHYT domain-containing protein n=1 Tax=Bdellovibrio sp. HCB209 TaxID=3394354 RepID=UPI0039B58DEE